MEAEELLKLPFAHSTKELAEKFLGDRTATKDTEIENLNVILAKFSETSKHSFPSEMQRQINDGKLSLDYLMLMIADDHPLLKDWDDRTRRRDLFHMFGRKRLDLQTALAERYIPIVRFGDAWDEKGIKKEISRYENFQEALLQRTTHSPLSRKK